ncbi:sugar transferase [Coprobacter sp.]
MKQKIQITKYLVGDIISVSLAWFLFNLFRYQLLNVQSSFGSLYGYLNSAIIIEGQILFPCLFLFIFYLSGYYNRPFLKSRLGEFFTTLLSTLLCTFIVFFIALLNDQSHVYTSYKLILGLFGILFFCVYTCRVFITQRATFRIHNRIWGFNTLIIGSGKKAQDLVHELNHMRKSMGYKIIGYVKTEETDESIPSDLPVFSLSELPEKIKEFSIEELIIAQEHHNRRNMHKLINSLYPLGLPIQIEASEYEMLTSRVKLSNIYGTPFIDISICSLSDCQKNIKRLLDVFLSTVALIILSPLFLFLAIKIKTDSKGPVIYKQQRIGYRRKEFTLYKFRTMINNAEQNGPALSSENDTRITPLGHIMRKYRLDELPQFWNVIKGDMSLVGPRPERKYFIDQLIRRAPYYSLLHQVRPGITSWGMVKFGYARNIDEMIKRLKYEILYLENMSLLVDLKIIIYTIKTVLTGKGI